MSGRFCLRSSCSFLNKRPGRQQQRTGREHLNQAKSATAVVDEQAGSTLTQYSTRHESVRGAKQGFRSRDRGMTPGMHLNKSIAKK